MSKRIILFSLLILMSCLSLLVAQPRQGLIQVIVSPTTPDWQVELGQRANFQVQVLENGLPVESPTIQYQIGMEQMPPEYFTF